MIQKWLLVKINKNKFAFFIKSRSKSLFKTSVNSFNQSAPRLVKLFLKKTITVPWLSAREGINYIHQKVLPPEWFKMSLNSFKQSDPWLVKLFPKKTIRVPWLSAREGVNYIYQKVLPPDWFKMSLNSFQAKWSLTSKNYFPRRQSECPSNLKTARNFFFDFQIFCFVSLAFTNVNHNLYIFECERDGSL